MNVQQFESRLSVMSLTELSCLEPLIKKYYNDVILKAASVDGLQAMKDCEAELQQRLYCLESAINDKIAHLLD